MSTAKTETKLFVNTSIQKGVIEFESHYHFWRFVKRSPGIWDRYVKTGNAYVYDGTTTVEGRATPRKLLQEVESKMSRQAYGP